MEKERKIQDSKTKQLILMRHSYAVSPREAKTDFERQLTGKGKTIAQKMSDNLKQYCPRIDLIIASAARRTMETAEIIKDKYPGTNIQPEKDLYYLQFTNLFFDFVYGLDESLTSVLFIGHNPVFTFLSQQFSGENIFLNPASLLIVDFKIRNWTEVSPINVSKTFFIDSLTIQEQNF